MKRISCEYNIDTACVEIKYDNGVMISIDCITVENTIPRNMYERSELDYLVYNDPAAYADLILLLNKIGKTLLEANDASSAEQFLSYAVSIGSDITASYTMLATIYADRHDKNQLNELIQKAETITSLSGRTIQIKLHFIKSGLK